MTDAPYARATGLWTGLADGLETEASAVAVAVVRCGHADERLRPTVRRHSVPTAGGEVARYWCRTAVSCSSPGDMKWTPGQASWWRTDKKLSCRKETVRLLRQSVLATYNWKTIFCGHYMSVFNHRDVIGLQSYWIRWNNAKDGLLCRSRSFKITDVGTNRKCICDFLLLINTNWHLSLIHISEPTRPY